MSKSDWKYNFEYKPIYNYDTTLYYSAYIHNFENIKDNFIIKRIKMEIKKFDDFDFNDQLNIKIFLKKNDEKINNAISNLCRNKKKLNAKGETILILYNCKNEVIFYLEKKIQLEILEKKLFIEEIILRNPNPYYHPKVLKHVINPNIKLIDFSKIGKIDREYHDNFVTSLNFEDKLKIIKYGLFYRLQESDFLYYLDLLNNEINDNLNITEINKLVKTIEFINKERKNGYEIIYKNNSIYLKYLNHLSIDDILKKLIDNKITENRSFEIINYLYTQCDLSFNQNMELIKIINNKYQQKELNILKNKIICKIITKNTNFNNEFFDELVKYEDSVEGLINLFLLKQI